MGLKRLALSINVQEILAFYYSALIKYVCLEPAQFMDAASCINMVISSYFKNTHMVASEAITLRLQKPVGDIVHLLYTVCVLN